MSTSQLWNPPKTPEDIAVWGLANRIDHQDILNAISKKSSVIAGLTVTAAGSGYTSAPTVTIGPPNLSYGIQATAIFTIVSMKLQLTLTNPGLGYIRAPTVTVTGGGGTGLEVVATVNYIDLTQYQLDPIPVFDMAQWNVLHQETHQDMLNATGQQSSDLESIDFANSDQEDLEEFIFEHVQDHLNARSVLTGYLPNE